MRTTDTLVSVESWYLRSPRQDWNAAYVQTGRVEHHQDQDGQLAAGLRVYMNSSIPVKLHDRQVMYHHTHTVLLFSVRTSISKCVLVASSTCCVIVQQQQLLCEVAAATAVLQRYRCTQTAASFTRSLSLQTKGRWKTQLLQADVLCCTEPLQLRSRYVHLKIDGTSTLIFTVKRVGVDRGIFIWLVFFNLVFKNEF